MPRFITEEDIASKGYIDTNVDRHTIFCKCKRCQMINDEKVRLVNAISKKKLGGNYA